MSVSDNDLFHFGTIIGTHGIRGDLKVRPLTRGSTELCNADEVFIRPEIGAVTAFTPVRAVVHKGNILLRLKGQENINLVTRFIGHDVLMGRSTNTGQENIHSSWQDIRGLEVIDRNCGALGQIEDKFTTAAHDIYVVQGPFGEVLIPVVDQFIEEVDIAGNRMMVDLPEGLVPEFDEN